VKLNLEQIWEELDETARAAGGMHSRLLTPQQALDIEAAVEGRSGQKLLLFRFERSVLRPDIDVPESHGIGVKRVVFPRDGNSHITLQLSLLEPRDLTIFVRVAEDLVELVGPKADPADALRTLIQRLSEWHRFMRRQSPAVLSKENQRGLFGELDFLLRYAIQYCGVEAAIAAWRGPKHALHDFEFPALTVEVKTTIAGGPTEFRVSNERQLDDSGLDLLVIYHPLFTETRESGTSLPEMAGLVRNAIGSAEGVRREFDEKISDYGYFEIHEKEYHNTRYVDRTRSFYRVAPGFPRIVESDLPVGVGSVSYSVSTVACVGFQIPDAEIIGQIRRPRS
jgi:hypothetical protein